VNIVLMPTPHPWYFTCQPAKKSAWTATKKAQIVQIIKITGLT